MTSKKFVRVINRNTRRKYSAEEKIRIVIEGMRGETSISELFRLEGITQILYYRRSKDFIVSGKKRFEGHTLRQATTSEVDGLRK